MERLWANARCSSATEAGAGLREVGEEMGLALGQAQRGLRRLEVQADAVGGAVDEGHELKTGFHAGFG